jgi:hypothetical protein
MAAAEPLFRSLKQCHLFQLHHYRASSVPPLSSKNLEVERYPQGNINTETSTLAMNANKTKRGTSTEANTISNKDRLRRRMASLPQV